MATELKRQMGLTALVVYGVGDMLGAGIYGLIGKAAGLMGNLLWLGFLGAMVAALLTGLSYASIGSRYPRAAGAAYATDKAWRLSWLTWVVGLSIAVSGLTSMATGSRVIAGYLQRFGVELPTVPLAIGALLLIGGVVMRGIRESTWLNVVCTTVEVVGLLIVIGVSLPYWGTVDLMQGPPDRDLSTTTAMTALVLQGAVLTFFSFLGFEDLLNMSEEAHNPERNMPRALIIALGITTAIYLAVAVSAVSVMSAVELGVSQAALVDVVARAAPRFPTSVFAAIGIFAVANTALINLIMGSRLLYGMSRQGLLPKAFGRVHEKRQTPQLAIVVLVVAVIALMLMADIDQLAAATSLLLLTSFVVVNVSLVVLQLRPGEPKGRFEVPVFVPILGALVCAALIIFRVFDPSANPRAPLIAGGVLLFLAATFFIVRPKRDVVAALGG
jgi:amino acid transporter